tara:strand:+ start:852 stop:1994 length:1143 start_codon:yes stop_codon:yes gene_type:complete
MDTAPESSRASRTHAGKPASARAEDPFVDPQPAQRASSDVAVTPQPVRTAGTGIARGPVALAGCILWRRSGAPRSATVEVALVLREGHWCLPRVVAHAGEDRRDAARRAARELCGTHTIDDAFIGERREQRAGHALSTWWWRVLPLSRDPAFEGAAWTTWLAFDEALARLATDEDRRVLSAGRPAHPPSAWRKRTTRGLAALDAELTLARAAYRDSQAVDDLALAEQHLARLDVAGARRALTEAHRHSALASDQRDREAWMRRLEDDVRGWPPGPWCAAFESATEAAIGDSLEQPTTNANQSFARIVETHAAGRRALSQVYFARRLQAAALGAVAAFGFALAMGASGWSLLGSAIGAAALFGLLAPSGPRTRSRIENDSI